MSCGFSRSPSRATVCCSRLVSPVRASSCFGLPRRDSGQSRVPAPPAMTIANIARRLEGSGIVAAGHVRLEARPELEGAAVGGPHRIGQDGADPTFLELVD